ncbi:MAG: NAD-dependent epimerase/dehydratase [Bacteroidales bacterium]|jgi:nucleoside-diphosphate-sugar epimerase|nr:NAD-dependent epimerase/dehydratase [Bacteroidales bacterium]
MNETVLLTGGTGFLGSHLVYELLQNNYRVILLKRSTSNTWRIDNVVNRVSCYDIDKTGLEAAFMDQHIDVVIHTACCYGRNNEPFSSIVATNISFGIKILECALYNKAGVFINSDTIFDKYFSPYTLSKRQFTEWLSFSSADIKVINMKLEHMYGPNDDNKKFVAWLLQQLEGNVEEIKLTSGIQKRDFIYITDAVSAYLTAISSRFGLCQFTEFEIGTGNAVPVRVFVEEMERQYKACHPNCKSILNFGAISYRKNENMNVTANISMLEKLKWSPKVNYITGIRKILDAGIITQEC